MFSPAHFHYLFVGDSAFWLAIFSKCLAIVLSWSENTDFSGPYCWDMFWCHWWDVNIPSQRPSLITFQLKTASRCFWVPKTVFSFGKQLQINLSHLQFGVLHHGNFPQYHAKSASVWDPISTYRSQVILERRQEFSQNKVIQSLVAKGFCRKIIPNVLSRFIFQNRFLQIKKIMISRPAFSHLGSRNLVFWCCFANHQNIGPMGLHF